MLHFTIAKTWLSGDNSFWYCFEKQLSGSQQPPSTEKWMFPLPLTICPSTHPLAYGSVYSRMNNMVLSGFFKLPLGWCSVFLSILPVHTQALLTAQGVCFKGRRDAAELSEDKEKPRIQVPEMGPCHTSPSTTHWPQSIHITESQILIPVYGTEKLQNLFF